MIFKSRIFIIFFFICSSIKIASEELTIDLREPTYVDGRISTIEGGVLATSNIRIQARRIVYQPKAESGRIVCAEGDLLIEVGDSRFVGDHLEYNLDTELGVILNGRSAVEPWYFGGKSILLYPDGQYVVDEAYLTTSESLNPSWQILAKELVLTCDKQVCATNTTFCFGGIPLFWIPKFHINLHTITDHPIRYSFRAGGRQGPRIGMSYEIFSRERFKTFLRIDYNLSRGFGGGLESYYKSMDGRERFHTINYYARDLSLSTPHRKNRYRLQGLYERYLFDDATTLHISYDKLSDKEMPSDYDDKGIVIESADRTQLHLRHQHPWWIANLLARYRANTFQTVKQELPTLEVRMRPIHLGPTGIIAENQFKASYLDFEYNKHLPAETDYTSPRVELNHRMYRSIHTCGWALTPEAGLVAIYYGNSPTKGEKWTSLAQVGGRVQTQRHKIFGPFKHIVEPYIQYNYYTSPTTAPDDHYIFDLSDGWAYLNQLQVGMRHQLFYKEGDGYPYRLLMLDLYTNAFFHTETIPKTLPKIYLDCVTYTTPRLRHRLSTAWDCEHQLIDHFNLRTEYTVNGDTAIAIEYRHRSPFDWRKGDRENFILDSFLSIDRLRASQLSDRRDTLIAHLFHRFHPDWALEVKSRYGFNREDERNYREVECNLLGTIRSTWHITASYQYREDDRRFSLSINVGLQKPSTYHPTTPTIPL